MKRTLLVGLLAIAAALSFLPAAAAHVTTETDDGQYFITTGQQGEPVYTFQPTNLDLIIRENADGERGAEVSGVNGTLQATLIGPGGEELSAPLQPQFGAEGRYEFAEGYVLTQPGIYELRLVGSIRDTAVDGVYAMPGPIVSQADIMFPDDDLPTVKDLAAENEALRARVDALEQQIGSTGTDGGDGGQGAAPGPGALLLLPLAGLLALVLRRRPAA